MADVHVAPPARLGGSWVPWAGALIELARELMFGQSTLPRSRLVASSRAVDPLRITSLRNSRGGTAFIDGAALADGRCGIAIYYTPGHPLNTHAHLQLPEHLSSDSNLAELAALVHCLMRHPRDEPLIVFSDSAHALRCTEVIAARDAVEGNSRRAAASRRRRANGGATTARALADPTNDPRWGALVLLIHLLLRLRRGKTSMFKVPAHKGWKSNEVADALAQKAAADGKNPMPIPAAGSSTRCLVTGIHWVRVIYWAIHYLYMHQTPGVVRATDSMHQHADGDHVRCGSGRSCAAGFARRQAERRNGRQGVGGNGSRRLGQRSEPVALPPPRPRVAVGMGAEPTQALAVDCEMVGVGASGLESKLASVCVVNQRLECVYFSYCVPPCSITDYRSAFSGINAEALVGAPPFQQVSREVFALLRGRIVVGHDLQHDFCALGFSHPMRLVRDTARGLPRVLGTQSGKPRKLRHLAAEMLGMEVQTGAHSPEEDAQAAMRLYQKFHHQFEAAVAEREERRRKFREMREKRGPICNRATNSINEPKMVHAELLEGECEQEDSDWGVLADAEVSDWSDREDCSKTGGQDSSKDPKEERDP